MTLHEFVRHERDAYDRAERNDATEIGMAYHEGRVSAAEYALTLAASERADLLAACRLALDALAALQDQDDGSLVSPARNALTLAVGKAEKGTTP